MTVERQLIGQEELTRSIHRAEGLRVRAVTYPEEGSRQFEDRTYLQALLLTIITITELESENTLQTTEDESILAAGAHLHAMAATILQSRAKHTLELDQHKQAARDDAQSQIDKLKPLAERLNEKQHHKSVDGTPFIWPLELNRIQARNLARYPKSTQEQLQQAQEHYYQAAEIGQTVYHQTPKDDTELRGYAIIATATARVEALQMELQIAQQANQQPNKKAIKQQLNQAEEEIDKGLELGYPQNDRINANRKRIKDIKKEITD